MLPRPMKSFGQDLAYHAAAGVASVAHAAVHVWPVHCIKAEAAAGRRQGADLL